MQLLINTLQIGAVYVLFSLGLTLIFGVMRIVNFAHGEFFSLAALLIAVGLPWFIGLGMSLAPAYVLASLLAIAAAVVLGKLLYDVGFRRFQRDMTGSFVLSIGIALLLQGLYIEVFTPESRKLPTLVDGTLHLLGAGITTERLVLCIIALAVGIAMYWIIAMTRLGLALRAVAEDHEAAMLQGIPYRRIAQSGFLLGTLLAAAAGALLAPVVVISPTIGSAYLIKGFIAVIIGGLGSIPGAILGSFLIAAMESVGGYFFDPTLAMITMFVMVMAVLLVRPTGIMGHG
ncbi:MAG: branched-chain amino acid ABC transporter permease [Burkholderiaceae bacterium]|nr:branched-chain amino acid ABC transporter permease [Burkholderiaceae bacterium]